MIQVPVKVSSPVSRNTMTEINRTLRQPVSAASLRQVLTQPANTPPPASAPHHISAHPEAIVSSPSSIPAHQTLPALFNPVRKGQKISLPLSPSGKLQIRLGWNVKNPSCDVDVSAFLLGSQGKVPGDGWFVFYGQEDSPDRSVHFSCDCQEDREMLSIDLARLNSQVEKIVFVLTIHDALSLKLNFSMIEDAYIRILDAASFEEYVSFSMTDYYDNVISMMIGELYLYKGNWKFSAVGNGVARDLAGLCELYGVQIL